MKDANEDADADERVPLLALRQIADISAQRKRRYKRGASVLNYSNRTWWDNFKDELWVKDQYPELDPKEVVKVTEKLELVISTDGEATDEMYNRCLRFKSRAIESANMLHFAIWVSSQSETARGIVQTLLERLKDPSQIFMPAILPAGKNPPKVVYVYAVHLAAGLGLLEELKALTSFAWNGQIESRRMAAQDYVNVWAVSAAKSTTHAEVVRPGDLTAVYQAIHEATYQGHADVALWLVENGADPCSKNEFNITPLHFVAWRGIDCDLPSLEIVKTNKLVQTMVAENDGLIANADMTKFLDVSDASTMDPKRMIPLEVAVHSASKFPQECIGLLAPCLVNHESYFDDIKRIASVTPRGALNLVRTIGSVGKRDPHLLRRFRLNAQMPGSSDVIGSIFYTAPQAASEMLDLLEIEPIVEDSAHYPVPAHVSLWGMFQNLPMRCAYQADTRSYGKLKIPSWEWSKYRGDLMSPIDKDKRNMYGTEVRNGWHKDFMPSVSQHARKGHIKKVKVVSYIVPGLLDIDIIMALARLQEENAEVTDRKPVEGMICCLWDNLVSMRWTANMAMMFYDLLALMTLAFFHHHVEHPAAIALSLAGVFGSVVRHVAEFGCALFSTMCKRVEFRDDPLMASMWGITTGWFAGSFLCPLIGALLQVLFLCTVSFGVSGVQEKSHADSWLEKMCFSACLLTSCLQFVVMWRFCSIGATIYTVRKTITSGAVNQTLFICGLIFTSVTLILLVWSGGSDFTMILAAFRGWLFADGDGFNALGFNKGLSTQVIFSMVMAFFFNVMTLNIIIAVYGHEYDKAQSNLKFMFLKGRAHYCASSILSSYLIPWRGKFFNRCLSSCAWFMMLLSICLSFTLQSVLVAGLLLGCGQRLLSMSLMQCDWVSPEGFDAEHEQRFLWICYPDDWKLWMNNESDHNQGAVDSKDSKEEIVYRTPVQDPGNAFSSRDSLMTPTGIGERITIGSTAEQPRLDVKLSALREELDRLMDAMESQIQH
mmetsp:Transcript_28469/g.45753  ORF Transcript_28469/g.45753 Transcript_28469/m.45753 type:complete len:997 (-) Transcript_28469:126-3116(-)